jgi:predicted metal-dependent enzyme (double-stranded beta helix superfamily)
MTTFTASARPSPDLATDLTSDLTTDLAHDPGRLAAELAARDQLWRPHVRFRHPRHYTRLLARPGWEAWLLTWLPGQSTGLHDHGGSAGAFAVVEGILEEAVLAPEAGRLVRRLRTYAAGEVRAFGRHHVHDVAPAAGPAVSLHVYAPGLTRMTRYALEDGALVSLGSEQAGADW